MDAKRARQTVTIVCFLLACCPAVTAHAQSPSETDTQERLQRLEERQAEFERMLDEKDARIRELEGELDQSSSAGAASSAANPDVGAGEARAAQSSEHGEYFGDYSPGKGFTVARGELGELTLSVYSYFRYLNQGGLDDTYVDHFGDVQTIDKRHDFQVNKVFLYTKGWFLDPNFRYLFYVWSTNTALGLTTNNLVAGNLSYTFNDAFTLTGGVVGLPSTRSMMGQFPYWHRVDARLIADEFMRGSFTQGLSAQGTITDGLIYNAAVGNNLSNFGVDAGKLDDEINTVSGALVWMPTTGEFGPRGSIGDFEHHTDLATQFGLHATFSTEDKQSQPGQNAPENTQIRLSSGVTVFTPDALAPGVTVDKVDYQMFALNGAMKYRGYALEAEVFYRMLDNFRTNQPLAIEQLTDRGAQLKGSTMLMPKTLQLYANGSKIFGEYGDPWDVGIGTNWWPFKRRGFRINAELMYLKDSPVGYASLPYTVGADGWIFVANAELAF